MPSTLSSPPTTPPLRHTIGYSSLSIKSILRLHPRERLLVQPLHWTHRHLQLLGCVFVHRESPLHQHEHGNNERQASSSASSNPCSINQSQPSPPSSPPRSPNKEGNPNTVNGITDAANGITDDARANKTIFSLASASASAPSCESDPSLSRHCRCVATLACSQWTATKVAAMQAILTSSPASMELTRERLLFRFESRKIPMLCFVFSRSVPSPATTVLAKATTMIPCVAYINYGDVCIARRNSLKYICIPGRNRRAMSTPTASLYALRLAQITPDDSHDDPYIAALLIALAQSNGHSLALVPPHSSPQSYCVHVLRTDPTDESYLTLYSADIPTTALRKLSDSNKPPRMPSDFSIFSKKVPFKPYSSFQERLHEFIIPRTSKQQRAREDVDPRGSKRQRT